MEISLATQLVETAKFETGRGEIPDSISTMSKLCLNRSNLTPTATYIAVKQSQISNYHNIAQNNR